MKAMRRQPASTGLDRDGFIAAGNGWLETTRRLKRNERTKRIPVVALTAHAHESVEKGAREAGCDAFVTKPCPPDELVKKINKLLDR